MGESQESQAHGFIWERSVLEGVYKIPPGSYTRQHDVGADENIISPGVNVSIKTSGGKSVDMGDARRVYNSLESLNLILIHYKQDGEEKVLKSVLEVDLTDAREVLFGSLSFAEISEFHEQLRGIPPGRPSVEAVLRYKTIASELNARSGAVKLRPKVDSGRQRRLQCSFPDFARFCAANPARVITKNTAGILRGFQIPLRILSGLRIRNLRL